MKKQIQKIINKSEKLTLGNKQRKRIENIFAYSLLIIFSLIILLPLIWIFLTSLKNRVQIYQIPPAWFFTPTLDNYLSIFDKYPFLKYFLNSSVVAVITTVLALSLGMLAAYSIARFNTGGNAFRLWILNSHTMPPVALLIPFFMLASTLKIRDTYFVVIMTHLSFLLPFTMWMLIGFFDSIQVDMEEAAMVDGATRLEAFLYITLPIAAPGLSATGIVSFLFSWNEFIFALVLTGNKTKTLPVATSAFLTQRGDLMGELSAAAMLMIIPVIILSIAFRNYLVKGLSLGAVK